MSLSLERYANDATQLADLLAASYSHSSLPPTSSSTSYSLRSGVPLSSPVSVTLRDLLTFHDASHKTRRVVLFNVIAAGIHIAILFIDVVLVVLYLIRQCAFVFDTPTYAAHIKNISTGIYVGDGCDAEWLHWIT